MKSQRAYPDIKKCTFIGKNVDLAGTGKADMLAVTTDNMCFCGHALCPFWVLSKSNKAYKVILDDGGVGFDTAEPKKNGLPSLTITVDDWQTTYWEFNGTNYVKVKEENRDR